jgi:hypothetical protein
MLTPPEEMQSTRWEFVQVQRHRNQLSDTNEHQRTWLNFLESVIPIRYTWIHGDDRDNLKVLILLCMIEVERVMGIESTSDDPSAPGNPLQSLINRSLRVYAKNCKTQY